MSLLADTEFKVFAQLLATKYRKGRKVEIFAQELFKEIYLPESEDDPVEETLPRTYRGYYYGQNDITELASQIAGSLDTANFASYLQTDSDDTIESLCTSFSSWYPDIDANNYCQRIAARFKDIIDHAAAPKTKIAPPAVATGRGVPGSLVDYDALMRKYGVPLVAEAYGECQNEGCTNSLYIRQNGTMIEDYAVTVIDPSRSADDATNLIAMCPTCGKLYARTADADMILRMKEIKQNLILESDAMGELAHEKIEKGLRNVLRKVKDLDPADIPDDFNYNPAMVRQKIEKQNKQLYFKIQMNVSAYYAQVDDILRQYGREGVIDFDMFCAQVKVSFQKLKRRQIPQKVIFDNLVKWLVDSTHEELEPCETVIAYFVQKCEVFDVITEQAVLV